MWKKTLGHVLVAEISLAHTLHQLPPSALFQSKGYRKAVAKVCPGKSYLESFQLVREVVQERTQFAFPSFARRTS
jgi:hypothetical protein